MDDSLETIPVWRGCRLLRRNICLREPSPAGQRLRCSQSRPVHRRVAETWYGSRIRPCGGFARLMKLRAMVHRRYCRMSRAEVFCAPNMCTRAAHWRFWRSGAHGRTRRLRCRRSRSGVGDRYLHFWHQPHGTISCIRTRDLVWECVEGLGEARNYHQWQTIVLFWRWHASLIWQRPGTRTFLNETGWYGN